MDSEGWIGVFALVAVIFVGVGVAQTLNLREATTKLQVSKERVLFLETRHKQIIEILGDSK